MCYNNSIINKNNLMKKLILTTKVIFFGVAFCLFFLFPFAGQAQSLGQKLTGRILLDVEGNGEAWYVWPENNKRYYLGRPNDAFSVMRELGLGIKEIDFEKIAEEGMPVDGDLELTKKLSGRIILQVEKNGEAWYINPVDLKKYYLGRPEDAFEIMRELSLGISKSDLSLVHKNGFNENINKYSKYEYNKKISTKSGDYYVDIIEIDLRNPKLKIITDTADNYNCKTNCQAKSLGDFVFDHNGFAGINGSYFDTSEAKKNYYFAPVYNTKEGKMINEDQLKYWTTGPIMAFDENNKFYYFKDSRDFKSVADFEKKYNTKLQAAIGNKPRLIEEKLNVLIDWELDDKQTNFKTIRNAFAYKNEGYGKETFYLVIARDATVPDLGDVMKAMEVDYALNMDGGYSTALIYNGEYVIEPGRDIPNAIIFSER